MSTGFATLGITPPGVRIRCENVIPHGRGLGSSSAAIVGGLALARALVVGGDERLPDAELFSVAADLEGHPDNVAAAVHGGLTIAFSDARGCRAVRLDPDPTLAFVVFVPPESLKTTVARGLLPDVVPHRDAARSAGRAALLVAALTRCPEELMAATEDWLHQPYRAPAMPASAELVASLRADGRAAVVSGAGPTVLAIVGKDDAGATAGRVPPGWRVHELDVDHDGVVRES
jgi:homoserine kinase